MDININNSKMNVNISNTKKDILMETNKIETQVENPSLNISTNSENLDINLGVPKIVTHEKNHANLENLNYENSGHTGFQPAGDYALKEEIPDTSNFATKDDIPDVSEFVTNEEIPTKTSELENDSGFITNDIETDFNIDGKLYLNTVKSGVGDATASRIVFGTPDKIYSYLSSNTSGAFAFSKGKGNITLYPNTGVYNCLMSDCNSDLGRSDRPWKDLYLSGSLKDGTNDIKIEDIVTNEGLKKSKFIIKEYATYDDLPKPIISYSYSTSFDYQWGPPEDYYYYTNGKWFADIESIQLYIENPLYLYTPEDLANVTCKITSELPTDLYPDITEDSFSLSMAYVETATTSYISAYYYPVLTTSYGDYEHNPYTLGLNLSFDITLPPKSNSEVAEDVIYKVLDTNKCYILDTETYEWVEFDESVLNLIPVMNFIDNIKQDKLVAGQNIATINNQNLLNGGNLDLVTSSNLSSYLLKTYVKNSRNTSTSGYTYDVRYINNMVKTTRTTASYNTYDCTYINGLIKTSKQSSNNYTYSCNYINNNFLTLDTLPRWDGGNE